MGTSTDTGNQAEELAKEYLCKQGLRLIERQYRSKLGEIDLIMQEQGTLVFIEVRYRESDEFGSPEETITQGKQRRLIRTAQFYQQTHAFTENLFSRFDVVAILGSKPNLKITWIPNAFGVQ
ncbi:MAG: YraN family protein [Candidatus Berkiella sp.]